MKRALIVGVNDYPSHPLAGCVNDALSMHRLLSKHDDGSPNFDCRLLVSSTDGILRSSLRENLQALFAGEMAVALFYFAGHGVLEQNSGWLLTQDAKAHDLGVGMDEVINLANGSGAAEVVIIIDCCHSGALGQLPHTTVEMAALRKGVTVLAATERNQTAAESGGRGLFTGLIEDALNGGAADILGRVTIADVYAYVDLLLGAWDQRPTFKTYVSRLTSLRNCEPRVEPALVRNLPTYFPNAGDVFKLDSSYEPEAEPRHPGHENTFGELQRLRDVGLLAPIGYDHMYYAAMNATGCSLTALGRYYHRLAEQGLI